MGPEFIEGNWTDEYRKATFEHNVELAVAIEKFPVYQIAVKSRLFYSKDDNGGKQHNAEYLVNNLHDYEIIETRGGAFHVDRRGYGEDKGQKN